MAQSTTAKQIATTGTVPDVELQRVFKMFGANTVVQGVDLQVQRGELFSILGPSGCGKTTLLRLIAGFEEPSAGEVLIQGNPMTYIPAYQRPVNTVFQSYALFGHMTIFDNVAFGLSVKGVAKPEIQQRAKDALKLVRLDHMSDRYPSQISGGQQQRVAIARALVTSPDIVLADEPTGALDSKTGAAVIDLLKDLHREGRTIVLITHDLEIAASAPRRVFLRDGQIERDERGVR